MVKRLWVLVVVGLTACMTPYQYKGLRGGYTSHAAGDGVFHITYDGNGYTSAHTITSYWLRRAAEVCGGPNRYQILSVQGNVEQSQIGEDKYVVSGNTITHETPIVVNRHSVAGYVKCLEDEAPSVAIAEAPQEPVVAPPEPVSKPFEDVWQYTEEVDESGAPPVDEHPYLFLGTLASSKNAKCEPRFAVTFGGLKDLGLPGVPCNFDTKHRYGGVVWTATCVRDGWVIGHSLLIGDEERLREGSALPSREAVYIDGGTRVGEEGSGSCTYNGFVWRRRAPSGFIVQ